MSRLLAEPVDNLFICLFICLFI